MAETSLTDRQDSGSSHRFPTTLPPRSYPTTATPNSTIEGTTTQRPRATDWGRLALLRAAVCGRPDPSRRCLGGRTRFRLAKRPDGQLSYGI
ncbi:hypothetical protein B0H12DRAFT_1123881 [Mycena haematopus]|nr:hypothetical protein B0H12DRAFT_1123881 [Mycena haematopus]